MNYLHRGWENNEIIFLLCLPFMRCHIHYAISREQYVQTLRYGAHVYTSHWVLRCITLHMYDKK